jgi:hypothetical protein
VAHAEAFFGSFDLGINVASEKRRSIAAPDARAALLKLFQNCGVEATTSNVVVTAAAAAGAFDHRL